MLTKHKDSNSLLIAKSPTYLLKSSKENNVYALRIHNFLGEQGLPALKDEVKYQNGMFKCIKILQKIFKKAFASLLTFAVFYSSFSSLLFKLHYFKHFFCAPFAIVNGNADVIFAVRLTRHGSSGEA